jgi:hypothetical protein
MTSLENANWRLEDDSAEKDDAESIAVKKKARRKASQLAAVEATVLDKPEAEEPSAEPVKRPHLRLVELANEDIQPNLAASEEGKHAVEEEIVFDRAAEKSSESSESKNKPQKSPEHIGHVLVSSSEVNPALEPSKPPAEAVKPTKEESKVASDKGAGPAMEKPLSSLSRAELLNLSEQIQVDGSSLRQIYETHLVGERGLRRLVAEHLQGGDIKKALRQEIVEREIDFERDPVLRDRTPVSVTTCRCQL